MVILEFLKDQNYLIKDGIGIVEGIIIASTSSDFKNGEKAWANIKDVEILD